MRTHTTTKHFIPHASEYLYHFPAYTEDAYCHLLSTSASCLVTATGGALTVPMFTNRRTLEGDGFWGGWREAVVTDVMPRSYASVGVKEGSGKGKGEEKVWKKSAACEIPQTQDAVGENSGTAMTPARTVGGIVPKETGGGGSFQGVETMSTTAMPGSNTESPDMDAEIGDEDPTGREETDAHTLTITKTECEEVTETVVVTETLFISELAIASNTTVQDWEWRRVAARED